MKHEIKPELASTVHAKKKDMLVLHKDDDADNLRRKESQILNSSKCTTSLLVNLVDESKWAT